MKNYYILAFLFASCLNVFSQTSKSTTSSVVSKTPTTSQTTKPTSSSTSSATKSPTTSTSTTTKPTSTKTSTKPTSTTTSTTTKTPATTPTTTNKTTTTTQASTATKPTSSAVNTTTQTETRNVDTIFMLSGKKKLVDVVKVNASSVFYISPVDATQQIELSRKNIEKINYTGGKKEVFNAPILAMVEELTWEAIFVTEDVSLVESMYKIGSVSGESNASSRNVKAAKSSAQIKLQKKAQTMGANAVLLTRSESRGGYGEMPGYFMEGIAYSNDPPPPSSENK